MATTDIQAIHTTALRNTHALEQRGRKQIEHQLSGLGQCLQHESALEAQKLIDANHIERLDMALGAVGASTSGFKEGVMGVAGQIAAAVHATAPGETLKTLYAGCAFQFDEVAASAFRSSMEEGRASADAIDGLIESVTREDLRLATSGQKADS